MWYAMQTETGLEEKVKKKLQMQVPTEILIDIMLPLREQQQRLHGQVITKQERLFPGYLLLKTDEIKDLYLALRQVDAFTRLIGTGREIVPLTETEMDLIESLGNEGVLRMSEGDIENGVVKILTGPFANRDCKVLKVDRHKRKATIQLEMFGRTMEVQIGIEIKHKS